MHPETSPFLPAKQLKRYCHDCRVSIPALWAGHKHSTLKIVKVILQEKKKNKNKNKTDQGRLDQADSLTEEQVSEYKEAFSLFVSTDQALVMPTGLTV